MQKLINPDFKCDTIYFFNRFKHDAIVHLTLRYMPSEIARDIARLMWKNDQILRLGFSKVSSIQIV